MSYLCELSAIHDNAYREPPGVLHSYSQTKATEELHLPSIVNAIGNTYEKCSPSVAHVSGLNDYISEAVSSSTLPSLFSVPSSTPSTAEDSAAALVP